MSVWPKTGLVPWELPLAFAPLAFTASVFWWSVDCFSECFIALFLIVVVTELVPPRIFYPEVLVQPV